MLERHYSGIIMTLIRCMRLSFTGSTPVADGDGQYAQVAGAGEASVYIWLAKSCVEFVGNILLSRNDGTSKLRCTCIRILVCASHSFAFVCFAGGIDLELAPQVVTALDDVCVLSPGSFDRPCLAALLGEVCLWLVEQRIGPRAQHARYRSCDPYAQVREVQITFFRSTLAAEQKPVFWEFGIRCRTGERQSLNHPRVPWFQVPSNNAFNSSAG